MSGRQSLTPEYFSSSKSNLRICNDVWITCPLQCATVHWLAHFWRSLGSQINPRVSPAPPMSGRQSLTPEYFSSSKSNLRICNYVWITCPLQCGTVHWLAHFWRSLGSQNNPRVSPAPPMSGRQSLTPEYFSSSKSNLRICNCVWITCQ
jgi:hypothetical protein